MSVHSSFNCVRVNFIQARIEAITFTIKKAYKIGNVHKSFPPNHGGIVASVEIVDKRLFKNDRNEMRHFKRFFSLVLIRGVLDLVSWNEILELFPDVMFIKRTFLTSESVEKKL